MDFKPTLIIGVGGTGCSIAEAVYAKAVSSGTQQRGQVGVLGLDTDDNDIRGMRHMGERQRVRFSSPKRIFNLLRDNPEVLDSWFLRDETLTHDIKNMSLIDGAGQVRILTRLGLHDAFKRGRVDTDIRRALLDLTQINNRDRFDGVVNIMVVGSLAGATGSGSFLQVALAARHIARENGIANAQVRGLFLLPDIFVRAASLPKDQEANVLANAYAALRELNAVMLATIGRIPLAQGDMEYMPGTRLREGQTPFEAVTLIDYENVKSQSLGKDLGYYKTMATNAAYTLMFTPIGQKFDSTAINAILTRLGAAATGNSNCYSSVGVVSLEYPQAEILDYLTQRFAYETLEGDWMRLDGMYQARVRQFQERRNAGDMSAQLEPAHISYVKDLDQLSRDNRPFFKRIHAGVHREVERENGEVEIEVQHKKMLDAFESYTLTSFRNRDAELRRIFEGAPVTSSAVADRETLADDVRKLDRSLVRDFRRLERSGRETPDEIYDGGVAAADTMAPAEWSDHHLEAHLIREAPNPVQARYFLYSLKALIMERMEALKPAALREKAIGAVGGFDQKKLKLDVDPGSPVTLATAEKIGAAGIFARLLNRDLKKFQGKYVAYHNDSTRLAREYVQGLVLQQCYQRLLNDVDELCQIEELLFAELETLRADIKVGLDRDSKRHEPGQGANQGVLYVYADAAAKDEIWNGIYGSASSARDTSKADRQLAAALFGELRQRRMKRVGRRREEPFSARALFREAVIEGYCRTSLEQDFSDQYTMSVIDAVRREAGLVAEKGGGADWKEYLRELVSLVSSQSEPFVALSDENAGDLVAFWSVNPALREQLGDDRLFEDLFTFQQGEQPIINPAFPLTSIACVNTRLNLILQDFAKLHSGDQTTNNVNAPSVGRYEKAYRDRVNALLNYKQSTHSAQQHSLTPHIHRDWHMPNELPELFDFVEEGFTRDFNLACAVALAYRWIERVETATGPVFEFVDPTRQHEGLNRETLVKSDNLNDAIDAAKLHLGFISAVLAGWDAAKGNWATPGGARADALEDTDTFARIADAGTLAGILSLSRDVGRDGPKRAAEIARGLFDAQAEVIRLQRDDLNTDARIRYFRETAGLQGDRALAALSGEGRLSEDTLRQVRAIPGNLIESVARSGAV